MIFDYRIVLRANSLETKQSWVKKLRQVLQETYFSSSTLNNLMKSPGKATSSGSSNNNNNNNNTNKNAGQRLSKEGGDEQNLCEPDQDINSLASFGSGNTTDSEKVSDEMFYFFYLTRAYQILWCYEKEMTHL